MSEPMSDEEWKEITKKSCDNCMYYLEDDEVEFYHASCEGCVSELWEKWELRQDIAALIAEVERLREANATLQEKWLQLMRKNGIILIK